MLLVIGCGYVGMRVAESRVRSNRPVWALTRSAARATTFRDQGIMPILGDVTRPETLDFQFAADDEAFDVLFAVGFDRKAGHSIEEVYVDGLRNVLDALQHNPPQRLIYLSSTGVYGDHQGGWVDEHTPCEPERPGGKACLAAEELLLSHPCSVAAGGSAGASILRLAGIYGPGRIPRLKDMKAGEPMAAPPNTWLNLIHVDDIVRIIELTFAASTVPQRLCVSDGAPVRRLDYYSAVAELAGAPAPVWTSDSNATSAYPRAAADKRIDNQRLMAFLESQQEPTLQYPDYRRGLAATLTT